MRYLFRGLIRDTAQPVEGHVEAGAEDAAYLSLSSNGIVTESLVPDPAPLNMNDELPQAPQFANALESAFDSSSSQVEFDALTDRYRGKKVWVIDRDKIRRRVAQVVDAALVIGTQQGEGGAAIRQRIHNALLGLFSDNSNLASERNADSMSGVRFNEAGGNGANGAVRRTSMAPPQPGAYLNNGAATGAGSPALEQQIGRLAGMIKTAEATLATISAAARRVGSGGGAGGSGPRRMAIQPADRSQEQNSVLLEIFKSNLALVQGMSGTIPVATETPAPASEASVVSESPAATPASPVPATEVAETNSAVTTVADTDAPLPMAERLD